MLKKSDNPQLFRHIASAYAKIDRSFDPILSKELSDEQLAKITSLKIDPTSLKDYNISSLNGIEQLTNLEELSIRGQDSRTRARDFNSAFERAKIVVGYDLESDLRVFQNEYNSCQLNEDEIKKISALKKLKKLDLSNQRRIGSIDLSQNPNLTEVTMQKCTSLKEVKGLDQLKVVKDPSSLENEDFYNCNFEFGGCYSLKNIENYAEVFDNLSKNSDANVHLHLPTATYAALYRDSQSKGVDFKEKMNEYQHQGFSPVDWVEISEGGVRAIHNSAQMAMATSRVEDIIRTQSQDNPEGDLDRVSRWYRWVCDNVEYDYEKLNKEKTGDEKQKESVKHKTRSSFTALWEKKAVCVGISNLFNYGVNLLGYSSAPILVSANGLDKDSRAVISDHQISALYLKGEDDKDIPLYCDPTWDLLQKDPNTGKVLNPESRYFCKTYDEMSVDHRFELSHYEDGKGATSIQRELKVLGMLRSKPPVKRNAQEKE